MTSVTLRLRRQVLTEDAGGYRDWHPVETWATWAVEHLALVLCDVWDRHWCPGAEMRLEAMLPRMMELVETLRSAGALIVHAPSETMNFYRTAPARVRAIVSPPLAVPAEQAISAPPLPVDADGGGCDCGHGSPHRAWQRQHPAIPIDEEQDVISDQGVEHLAVYAQRGITQVLLMGVHTNMCILNRSFAIKQLARWGVPVVLVRDLTDAMYDPERPPYVSHAAGTQLVIDYIEKFWCPTTTSAELLTALP
ncbi:MAG: isochorismatase [Chloroflexi bacterium]|nr:isochorismatase [Chloroflexota bacterium]